MIKTNELNHNGYFNHNGLIVQISGFRTYSTDKPLVRFQNTGGEYGIDSLQPIPLTEEWILNFGFKLDMENFNWNAAIGENEIGDFKLALRYSERIGWFFQSKCTVLKYVHQLQNLYFAISGEELVFSTEP